MNSLYLIWIHELDFIIWIHDMNSWLKIKVNSTSWIHGIEFFKWNMGNDFILMNSYLWFHVWLSQNFSEAAHCNQLKHWSLVISLISVRVSTCHQGQGSCEARPWLPEHQLECRSDLSAGLEPAIETGHWHRPGISCLGPVTVQVASWHSESPRACQGGYGQASAALAQTQFKLPVWNSPIPGPASAARLGAGYQSTNLNLVVTWVQSLPVK